MRIRTIALTCALAAPMWMACGGPDSSGSEALQPLTTEEVPQQSADNLESMIDGAADALAFVEDSDFMGTVTDVLGGGEDEGDCWTYDEELDQEVPCDDMGEGGEGDDLASGLSEMAQDVADWLKDEVFVNGTESEDGLTVTYAISPETICDFGGGDEPDMSEPASPSGMPISPPDEEDQGDPDNAPEPPDVDVDVDEEEGKSCEEVFTEEPVALAVTSTGSGKIDVAVLFGQAQLSPINFFFHPTQLGVEVDLGLTLDVLAVYAAAVGEDAPELPVTLSGAVSATLSKDAEKIYTLGASITKKIEVNGTMDGDSYSLSVAASNNLAALTLDGATESLTASVNVGAVDVSAPASWLDGGCESEPGMVSTSPAPPEWIDEPDDENGEGEGDEDPWEEEEPWVDEYEDPCADEEPLTGTYEAHLGGFTAAVTLDGDTDALTLNNLGLGSTTTTVSRNGDTLIGADLNADHGRALDLTIHSDENAMTIQIDPALVVSVAFSLAGADGMFEGAPEWLHDEVSTLSLAGAAQPAIRVDFGDEETESEGGVSIEAGTLTLTSTSLEEDVVVEAGMCLLFTDDGDDDKATAPVPVPHDDDEPWEEEDWEEEEDDDAHPFTYVEAGSCE